MKNFSFLLRAENFRPGDKPIVKATIEPLMLKALRDAGFTVDAVEIVPGSLTYRDLPDTSQAEAEAV